MRMYPSVALSMPRYSPKEGIELAREFIPNGYRIGMNSTVIHFEKTASRQDADEFKPERWLVSEEKWKAMDEHLLIFGTGTRTCIGKDISITCTYRIS
jgi:cytochrome P450